MERFDTKKFSKSQEKQVAQEISGKTVIASGALWGSKGDVRNDTFLVECKTTTKKSYRLNFKTWDKIVSEAVKDGLRFPVMSIDIDNGKRRFAVFQSSLFASIDGVPSPCLRFGYQYKTSYLLRSDTPSFIFEVCYINYLGKASSFVVADWEDFLKWRNYIE